MSPVFLCILLGYYLDTYLEINSSLLLLAFGFLAGGRNGWLLLKRMTAGEEERTGEIGQERSHETGAGEESDEDE